MLVHSCCFRSVTLPTRPPPIVRPFVTIRSGLQKRLNRVQTAPRVIRLFHESPQPPGVYVRYASISVTRTAGGPIGRRLPMTVT